jgi:hypothetical protein
LLIKSQSTNVPHYYFWGESYSTGAKPIPLGPYALEDLIKKFDLLADVFDK